MPINRHQVKSKSLVAYVLQCYPETKGYLPTTEILSKSTFYNMVKKFNIVYLKPDKGRKSKGIIRVDRIKPNTYLCSKSYKKKQLKFGNLHDLWVHVHNSTSNTRYIIQQGIDSTTKTKSSQNFDLRCHALRIQGEWVVAGICTRLGSPGNIVTTSHFGGTPIPMETLFTELLDYTEEEQAEVTDRLHECILQAVKVVSLIFPKNFEFAVDIGLDTEKQVWIYEVNNEPLIRGNFKLLPDKSLYRKVKILRKKAK